MKKYLLTLLTVVMCLALVFAMAACNSEEPVEPLPIPMRKQKSSPILSWNSAKVCPPIS